MIALDLTHIYVMIVVFIGILMITKLERISFLKSRKLLAGFLIIPTIIAIPLHLHTLSLLNAYNQGDIYLIENRTGILQAAEKLEIGPLSNWYVKCPILIYISPGTNISIYLMDLNMPHVTHQQEIDEVYNHTSLQLPYLFTENGEIANWTLIVENPTSETVEYNLSPILLEDSMYIAKHSIYKPGYTPAFVVMSIYFSISIIGLVDMGKTRCSGYSGFDGIGFLLLAIISVLMVSFLPHGYFPLTSYSLIAIILLYILGNTSSLMQIKIKEGKSINAIISWIVLIIGTLFLVPHLLVIPLLGGAFLVLLIVIYDFRNED